MAIKWINLAGRTGYFLAAGVLIPTYTLPDNELILVDSGLREDPELLEFLSERKLRVYAVLQTHLHIDHVANNKTFYRLFGTRIFATEKEISRINTGTGLMREWNIQTSLHQDGYTGDYEYPFEIISEDTQEIVLRDTPFRVVPLPGHSLGHIGFATPDNVLCIGDAILSPFMVHHAKLPYFEDIRASIDSMRRIGASHYAWYTLAHMEAVAGRDMPGLIRENIALQDRVNHEILEVVNDPVPAEDLIDSILYAFDIHVHDRELHDYIWLATRHRIKYMEELGLIEAVPGEGKTLYGITEKGREKVR